MISPLTLPQASVMFTPKAMLQTAGISPAPQVAVKHLLIAYAF